MAVNGELRASDRDREATVRVLRDAYVAGRLDLAELRDRSGAAYQARTWADLYELTDDIPRPGLVPRPELQVPAWSRSARGPGPGWLAAPLLLITLAVVAVATAAWESPAAIPLLVLCLSVLSAAGCSAMSLARPSGGMPERPGCRRP
jgi:Domain of unknown function (DUF1707)